MTSSPVAFEDRICAEILSGTPIDTMMILFTACIISRGEWVFFTVLSESKGLIDVMIDSALVWYWLSKHIDCKAQDTVRRMVNGANYNQSLPTIVNPSIIKVSPVCVVS